MSDRRPRLDAMLRAIEEGKYDDDLSEIKAAIQSRLEHRKEAVMKMVAEVFGEEHEIVPKGKKLSEPAKDHLNVVKHRSPEWEPAVDAVIESDPDQVIAAEKPPEGGLTGEFESRSPQFGSLDTTEGGNDG